MVKNNVIVYIVTLKRVERNIIGVLKVLEVLY